MGRCFRTFIDNSLKTQCKKCHADLYENGDYLTIETNKGLAIFVDSRKLQNYIEMQDTSKTSYLQMSNLVNIFDDDVCLSTNQTETTINVYCRICNNQIGWKFNNYCIILT
jgi:hypothetical protein